MTTATTEGVLRPEEPTATLPGAARTAALLLGLLVLAGCASGPQAHPDDPLEPYNRSMTRFNYAVDSALLKPVATAYQQATPAPAEHSIADGGVIDELAGDHRGPRLVFVNGVFAAALSDTGSAEDVLWLGDAEALRPRRTPGAPAPQDEPVDGFHALNWAAGVDVAAVLA